MDVSHPKVKYHWFISLTENGQDEQKKTVLLIKNLPKLVKISKKGLIFERAFTPEFLNLLKAGPTIIYLRILFKLQGHANWRSFDIKKLWPASLDATKELFFQLEEDGAIDFNLTFDQSKF